MPDGTKTLEDFKVSKLHPDAKVPVRFHDNDAGIDLHSCEDVTLEAGRGHVTSTGIAVAVPDGFVGMIADRSSMARRGIKTAGGIIDPGYRGEVGVVLWNISKSTIRLRKGDRIAQLLLIPIATPKVTEVKSLDDTKRGSGGFGSTGR